MPDVREDLREDQAQIADVLVRYASGIDRRDWPLFRTCWTDEIDADYGDIGHFDTVDAITDIMVAMHAGVGETLHRMTNFTIDVTGDTASSRSYVHAIVMAGPTDPTGWVEAAGHYDDALVRTAEGWRISRRRFTMVRLISS